MPSAPIRRICCATAICLANGLTGCVTALSTYGQPYSEHLRILATSPQRFTVRVINGNEYSPSPKGTVEIEIPRVQRGCKMHLFGIVKIADASANARKVVFIRHGSHVVLHLSLNDMEKLPVDSKGYRTVRVW